MCGRRLMLETDRHCTHIGRPGAGRGRLRACRTWLKSINVDYQYNTLFTMYRLCSFFG